MADAFDVMNKYTRFRTRGGATADEAEKRLKRTRNSFFFGNSPGLSKAEKAFEDLRAKAAESMKALSGATDTLSLDDLSAAPKLEGLFSKKEKEQQEKSKQNFELRKEEILRRKRMPGIAQTRLVGMV